MKEYLVIYEQAGTNYSAYAPDLPGCVAAADTIEETEKLMKTAIEMYLEALHEEGRSIPEPVTRAGLLQVNART